MNRNKCDHCSFNLYENPTKVCQQCRNIIAVTLQVNGFKPDGRTWRRDSTGEQFGTVEQAWRAWLSETESAVYYEGLSNEIIE